ncbi:MAG: histidine phosphatase family protein [Acidobacteria bacterium]|nr:histidine phosphatase family protein [Acidobacteriota bacterium]
MPHLQCYTFFMEDLRFYDSLPPIVSLKEIYMVRHGHPEEDPEIPYDCVPGSCLSETGREEARCAALFLLNRGIKRLYSSPFERTLSTARIIAAELGLPVIVEELLADQHDNESFAEVQKRIESFFRRLARKRATTVALISHGSPVKALLHLLSYNRIDLTHRAFSNANPVPTGGVWYGRREGDDWRLNLVFEPEGERSRARPVGA